MSERLEWLGTEQPSLDTVTVREVGRAALGFFGGASQAGATKNEDAALVWDDAEAGWTFAAALDAHGTAASARAVLKRLSDEYSSVARCLAQAPASAFAKLERHILATFEDADFQAECAALRGETALLCVAQKGGYLWWFSVGDCLVYLLHPETMRLGQYALNQRHFFQWIGEVNTFAQPCATYSSGRFMLRQGLSHVVPVTDGVLEFGSRPLDNPARLAQEVCSSHSPAAAAHALLEQVQVGMGRDSATVLCWSVENTEAVMQPSA
ncbi:protein phosphatase 2C domain-containing protein [Deinococcus lacus]|uniref:Protein phosphatase 2C domain-containing protein n=1 Tax=Deinococcus lacus TaxID=392561 RepID=A0ABW1Y943_9DEIO